MLSIRLRSISISVCIISNRSSLFHYMHNAMLKELTSIRQRSRQTAPIFSPARSENGQFIRTKKKFYSFSRTGYARRYYLLLFTHIEWIYI